MGPILREKPMPVDIDLAVLFDDIFYKKALEAIGCMELIALRLERALGKKIDITALNRAYFLLKGQNRHVRFTYSLTSRIFFFYDG